MEVGADRLDDRRVGDRRHIALPLLAGLLGIDAGGDVDRQHELEVDRQVLGGRRGDRQQGADEQACG